MDEVKFVEAAATETAAVAVPKRKSKKAKIEPVAVDSFDAEPVNAPVVRLPEMKCGERLVLSMKAEAIRSPMRD